MFGYSGTDLVHVMYAVQIILAQFNKFSHLVHVQVGEPVSRECGPEAEG